MPDPLISLLLGIMILAASLVLIWPKSGLISRWLRLRQLSKRVLREDALKHIQKDEIKNQPTTIQSVAGALNINPNHAADLLSEMEMHDLVTLHGGELKLTSTGRDYALHIIRAHRLWEQYLAEETGYAETEWHALAEQYEHTLTPDQATALDLKLGRPTHDPHGDPIPTEHGEVVAHGGVPLTALKQNQNGRIVHIEDEPEAVSAQLAAEGLYPGMQVHLSEATKKRILFWANGEQHLLAPIVAANISVIPETRPVPIESVTADPLSTLGPGEKGRVLNISVRCRGPERRRLMDLGVIPGTVITMEMNSPSGDPTAYRIRGAVIALRDEQANMINIQRLTEENE